MLNQFLDHWNHINVDVVSGFNIDGFDIPYLVNRISNVMGDDQVKRLSPWKLVTPRKVKGKFGKEDIEYDIAGISSLDFLSLYLKFTYIKREQNSLDYISQVELGVGKLHNSFSTFKEFYSGECDIRHVEEDETDKLRLLAYKRTRMKEELVRRGLFDKLPADRI